jgi:nitrogenase molybdenum-iron protein alpha/beta subunit
VLNNRHPDGEHITFQGTLRELLEKVEIGEYVPKLQASHAPPCKFWTAFSVIKGVRNCVPLVHGPTGCTYSVGSAYRLTGCDYRGLPVEPTTCTAMDETNVVYGGEGKLREAIQEVHARYHPDLITVLSCCCSGIICDDVETVAEEMELELGLPVLAIRSEGFGGDFRSGHEDAFRALIKLMVPASEPLQRTINIVGARVGPTYTEWTQDLDELERLVRSIGADINAVIAGGCTLEQIRRAPAATLNASWCYDWGMKIGQLMQDRFAVPYSDTGLPYGLVATEEWIRGIAEPLDLMSEAKGFMSGERRGVADDLRTMEGHLRGRTALIEITEYPGPIRALALARMAEEFGARPIVINLHPYTVKERKPSLRFLLEQGQNPEVILTRGLFSLGGFESSRDTELEVEQIAAAYQNAIYFGIPGRFLDCPVVNLSTEVGMPQFGYRGIHNMARLVSRAVKGVGHPRSKLFRQVLYDDAGEVQSDARGFRRRMRCPHRRSLSTPPDGMSSTSAEQTGDLAEGGN